MRPNQHGDAPDRGGANDTESATTARPRDARQQDPTRGKTAQQKQTYLKKSTGKGQAKLPSSAPRKQQLADPLATEATPIKADDGLGTLPSEAHRKELSSLVNGLRSHGGGAEEGAHRQQPASTGGKGRPKQSAVLSPQTSMATRRRSPRQKKARSPKHLRRVSSDRGLPGVAEAGLVPPNLTDAEAASAYLPRQRSGKTRKSQSRPKSSNRRPGQPQAPGRSHFFSSERGQSSRYEQATEETTEPDLYQGIRHQHALESRKEIKTRLRLLFMNYCDFNYETSLPFISQTSFQKLARDARITGKDSHLQQNDISVMIAATLQLKINLVKAITFQQYLDCILAVSELKEPSLFAANPKAALKKIVSENFVPLLAKIETKAAGVTKPHTSAGKSKGQNFTFSRLDASQRQIVYNDDTLAIFTDIMPLLRTLYATYFDMEVNATKGMVSQSQKDLRNYSLKSCLQLLKEFEICPYMVSKRTCTIVWYTVQEQQLGKKQSRRGGIQELCNHADQREIFQPSLNLGRTFTLEHLVIFFYRIAILAFDSTTHSDPAQVREFNLIKKLLHFLHQVEQSENLLKFMKKIGRTYTKTLSFLPSKDLLAQILVCEGLDKYMTGKTIDQTSKEDLVSRILYGQQYVDVEYQTARLKTVVQQQAIQEENDVGAVLEQHEDKLKQAY